MVTDSKNRGFKWFTAPVFSLSPLKMDGSRELRFDVVRFTVRGKVYSFQDKTRSITSTEEDGTAIRNNLEATFSVYCLYQEYTERERKTIFHHFFVIARITTVLCTTFIFSTK